MPEKAAFVAMKFDKDPWNDKRFTVISEVLEEAGFTVERGDALPTSAVVMAEVAARLSTADLVVVDTTGDSHNVSYELGYCHGQGREAQNLILIRSERDGPAPFNYAHYRHLQYRDLRHLRTLLRYRFAISTPLSDAQTGFALGFDSEHYRGDSGIYGIPVARAVLNALEVQQFTGRCEFYAGNPVLRWPTYYVIGLGLKALKASVTPSSKWFRSFVEEVAMQIRTVGEGVTFVPYSEEVTTMHSMRASLLRRDVVELDKGKVVRLLSPGQTDSWFGGEVMDRLRIAE